MTDPVEVIARGLCALRLRQNMSNWQRELPAEHYEAAIEACLPHFVDQARAAVAALEAEGFTVAATARPPGPATSGPVEQE